MLIAEIGINHMGSLEKAKQMIRQVKIAQWDYVKFQKFTLDLFVRPDERDTIRQTPFGEMTIYEYRKKLDFGREEYDQIYEYCQSLGIKFICSAFDAEAVRFLAPYEMDFIKIPSLGVLDASLLAESKKRPVMLSTGMSRKDDILTAVRHIGDSLKYIAHCVSAYPTHPSDANLQLIQTLKAAFPDKIIGYSGHEKGYLLSVVAAALGAEFVERHITLDKDQPGTDIPCSLDMAEMIILRKGIEDVRAAISDAKKDIYECEVAAMNKLRVRCDAK